MKKLLVVAVVMMIAVFAQGQVVEDVKYYIVNDSGRTMDVKGGSKDNGAAIHLWDKSDNVASQKWIFISAGDGIYYIKNAGTGKTLDITKGVDKSGTKMNQYTPNFTTSQRFKLVPAANGTFYIQTLKGNFLSSETVHGFKGSKVMLWKKNDKATWKFIQAKK